MENLELILMRISEVCADKSKKGGGSKLNRTQMVTLRLDPRLRYLTDLAARTQRRTTSGFIEWAIEEAIDNLELRYDSVNDEKYTLGSESYWLWDVDEADRFVKLAGRYTNLLTHDEQILWKIILDADFLCNLKYVVPAPPGLPPIPPTEPRLDSRLLRKYWNDLKLVAKREMTIESLSEKFSGQENG